MLDPISQFYLIIPLMWNDTGCNPSVITVWTNASASLGGFKAQYSIQKAIARLFPLTGREENINAQKNRSCCMLIHITSWRWEREQSWSFLAVIPAKSLCKTGPKTRDEAKGAQQDTTSRKHSTPWGELFEWNQTRKSGTTSEVW